MPRALRAGRTADMIDRILEWLVDELTWGGALVGVLFIAGTAALSLAAAGFWLVMLPPTYFQKNHPREWGPHLHPVLRFVLRIVKNVCGLVLIVIGLLLSLPGVPGPGVLTAIIGLTLLEFPGKHRIERRVIGRPGVLRAINRLRARYGRVPLELDDPLSGSSHTTTR